MGRQQVKVGQHKAQVERHKAQVERRRARGATNPRSWKGLHGWVDQPRAQPVEERLVVERQVEGLAPRQPLAGLVVDVRPGGEVVVGGLLEDLAPHCGECALRVFRSTICSQTVEETEYPNHKYPHAWFRGENASAWLRETCHWRWP